MKKIINTLMLLALTQFLFAAGDFKKHSAEIFVTPSADYFFGKKSFEPYTDKMPFIGFGFGAQYMYRPVHVFGISTGISHKMQGTYIKHEHSFILYDSTSTSINYEGYLSVPLHFHLFKKVEVSDFEFTTGPEFNLPIYSRSATKSTTSIGRESSSTSFSTNGTDVIRNNAVLGWVVGLGAHRQVNEHLGIYAGVDLRFLDIASFNKDYKKSLDNGDIYNCSVGVKVGFRIS